MFTASANPVIAKQPTTMAELMASREPAYKGGSAAPATQPAGAYSSASAPQPHAVTGVPTNANLSFAAPSQSQSSSSLPFGIGNMVSNAMNSVKQGAASIVAPKPAPAPRDPMAPAGVDTYTPGALISQQYKQAAPQMAATQQLGAGIQSQGAAVQGQQQAQADAFNRTGQRFDATSQSVASQPTGFFDPRTGKPAMTAGFNVGAQMPTTGGTPAPAALKPLGAAPTIGQIANTAGQLGAMPQAASVGNVAGRLGGAPQAAGVGNIAGQLGAGPGGVNPAALGGYQQVGGNLGGGYQVGNVGGIAGQLGGAPQVGNVGNIQMGQGPGAIAGQLGNQGASNADQQGMLSRLNGFLDGPEGPSVAEAQLKQAQAGNMADLIGAARSGRGGAGASAQALRGAMSEGSALMSDTAGQLATLRAQEADMQKNRQLSAIGLGGQMSEAQRAQDLGFRGQNLTALQGDQSTSLAGRGQDLQAAMANQGTQTALEQLRANTALGARGQNLSALQGDQGTALGLEGLRAQTATTNRGQDLNALTADQSAGLTARGQNLSALQGNQQTDLGARAQNLGALTADQGTQAQMSLGQLQASLGARGQDLSALQGDQATQAQMGLGNLQASVAGRGQNLSALQGDQSTALGREGLAAQTALGARGQDLSLLQGNQATALGARGQDVTQQLGMANVNLGMRGQDASVLTGDADRNLAAQRLGLDAGLGYGQLANTADQSGLNFLSQANQQGVMTQGMQNDLTSNLFNNQTSLVNNERAVQAGIQQQAMANNAQPGFWEQLALNTVGGAAQGAGGAAATAALSDERAKTDISSLDAIADHLRGAPGYRYRYKPGFGEDPDVEHAGPMAQDLERGPFGKALVKHGADGLRRVDTSRLSLVNHAALSSMRSELDKLKAALEA